MNSAISDFGINTQEEASQELNNIFKFRKRQTVTEHISNVRLLAMKIKKNHKLASMNKTLQDAEVVKENVFF